MQNRLLRIQGKNICGIFPSILFLNKYACYCLNRTSNATPLVSFVWQLYMRGCSQTLFLKTQICAILGDHTPNAKSFASYPSQKHMWYFPIYSFFKQIC